MTQTAVAKILGLTQGRVSAIEKGAFSRSEVDTLAACVKALGESSSSWPPSATYRLCWGKAKRRARHTDIALGTDTADE
ncbi:MULTISPECIES: helix-turn-helix domain-containing protein [unclassified Streptomyces]|uniref:helix-turn-helix domain-containing protein n=1 Tax=unclassified Streptomyces TaxID=2593676 RepID=UPI0021B15341|nr:MULTISPECIES: helix-turn-helix domain-containing protein [unclassified Streptomyces]